MSIELRIESLLKNDAARVFIKANPAQTVDSLISAYCIEKGIRQRTSYVLTTDLNQCLPNVSTVGACGLKNGDILYLKTESVDEGKAFGCNNWWVLATVCILIGTVGIVTVSVIVNSQQADPKQFGVVFDAGSTHTKAFVYRWMGDKVNNTGAVEQETSCEVKGPPLAFLRNKVKETFSSCLDETAKAIPASQQSTSPVYLGATAGMRVLNATSPQMAELILEEVRTTFSSSVLQVQNRKDQVRILSGSEEGSFGWITVNYLLGSFGNFIKTPQWDLVPTSPNPAVGALDMGGASLQITFLPAKSSEIMPAEQTVQLSLFGQNYTVYTTSFLCYGKMEAERRLLALLVKEQGYSENITNPCAPQGNMTSVSGVDVFHPPCTSADGRVIPEGTVYKFQGTGNSAQCREAVNKLVNTSQCQYKQCAFDGVYMPPLYGSFIAFNSFLFVARDLNLTTGAPPDQGLFSLEAFRNATSNLCNKTYDELVSLPASFRTKLCFDAHYIDVILTKGFHFTSDYWRKHLYFKRKIRGFEVGWTLGFMINTTNSFPATSTVAPLSPFAFGLLLTIFILFLLTSIGFACQAHRVNDKKGMYKKLTQEGQAYGSI